MALIEEGIRASYDEAFGAFLGLCMAAGSNAILANYDRAENLGLADSDFDNWLHAQGFTWDVSTDNGDDGAIWIHKALGLAVLTVPCNREYSVHPLSELDDLTARFYERANDRLCDFDDTQEVL